MSSSATDTTMSKPVAENEFANGSAGAAQEPSPIASALNKKVGIRDKLIRNTAPKKVILLFIFLRKSLVGLPALMPGINPPYC